MSDSSSPLLPHGGYEKLRAYVVAEAVYDATVVFCNRFIDRARGPMIRWCRRRAAEFATSARAAVRRQPPAKPK